MADIAVLFGCRCIVKRQEQIAPLERPRSTENLSIVRTRNSFVALNRICSEDYMIASPGTASYFNVMKVFSIILLSADLLHFK